MQRIVYNTSILTDSQQTPILSEDASKDNLISSNYSSISARISARNLISKRKFTNSEDKRLLDLVAIHGDTNWIAIAGLMPGRTARQCRDRYRNYLAPSIINRPWTPEEDLHLVDLVRLNGTKWSELTQHFCERSSFDLKRRYKQLEKRLGLKNTPRHLIQPGDTEHPSHYEDDNAEPGSYLLDF